MKENNKYTKRPDDFIHKDIGEQQAIDYLLAAFEGTDTKGSDLNIFNNILYGEFYLKIGVNIQDVIACRIS